MYASIRVSARASTTLHGRFRLCIWITMCSLLAIGSLDQAVAKTIRRTYNYSTFKITRAVSRLASYKLTGPGGRDLSATAMPDIVRHMQSVMSEHKTDGVKIKLEGFADRPEDAKALLFSLRNATGGATPFVLLEDRKHPSVDKLSTDERWRKLNESIHAEFQQRAMNAPINALYVIKKTGEIKKGDSPWDSPYSYIQHAVISEFGGRGQINVTVKTTWYGHLSDIIERFCALLNAVYAHIFFVQLQQNHVQAVRLAKQRLASELGMTYEELSKEIQIEVWNMQIAVWDRVRLAEFME